MKLDYNNKATFNIMIKNKLNILVKFINILSIKSKPYPDNMIFNGKYQIKKSFLVFQMKVSKTTNKITKYNKTIKTSSNCTYQLFLQGLRIN